VNGRRFLKGRATCEALQSLDRVDGSDNAPVEPSLNDDSLRDKRARHEGKRVLLG
jgi:hypothetical protein